MQDSLDDGEEPPHSSSASQPRVMSHVATANIHGVWGHHQRILEVLDRSNPAPGPILNEISGPSRSSHPILNQSPPRVLSGAPEGWVLLHLQAVSLLTEVLTASARQHDNAVPVSGAGHLEKLCMSLLSRDRQVQAMRHVLLASCPGMGRVSFFAALQGEQ